MQINILQPNYKTLTHKNIIYKKTLHHKYNIFNKFKIRYKSITSKLSTCIIIYFDIEAMIQVQVSMDYTQEVI